MSNVYPSSVLSFLLPGLGQIYNGNILFGYVIFIIWSISIWFFIIYNGWWLIITIIVHISSVLETKQRWEWK